MSTGEDVVADVYQDGSLRGEYEVVNPMVVEVTFRGKDSLMMLHHWLPVQIVERNRTIIKEKNIVAMMQPNDVFMEYYINTVDKLTRIMESKETMDKLDKVSKDGDMDGMLRDFQNLEKDDNDDLH
jgi:hypothetical protein